MDHDQSVFPFLLLPSEIRNKIYRHAFVSVTACPIVLAAQAHQEYSVITKKFPVNLLRVCRQICGEASSILYSENRFHCRSLGFSSPKQDWNHNKNDASESGTFPASRIKNIRSLTVRVTDRQKGISGQAIHQVRIITEYLSSHECQLRHLGLRFIFDDLNALENFCQLPNTLDQICSLEVTEKIKLCWPFLPEGWTHRYNTRKLVCHYPNLIAQRKDWRITAGNEKEKEQRRQRWIMDIGCTPPEQVMTWTIRPQ